MKEIRTSIIVMLAVIGLAAGVAFADPPGPEKGKAHDWSSSNRQSDQGATRGLDRADERRSEKSKGKAFDPDREQYPDSDKGDEKKKEKVKDMEKNKGIDDDRVGDEDRKMEKEKDQELKVERKREKAAKRWWWPFGGE